MRPGQELTRLILTGILVGCTTALGQTLDTDWRALVDLRHEARDLAITALEPRKGFLGQSSSEATATAVLSGEGIYADFVAEGQLRVRDTTLNVDEIFLEKQLTESVFAFAGRRNIAFGQAYGVSPADVFLDLHAEDRGLNYSRRRLETKGQDMLGVEAFVSDNITLLSLLAPSNDLMNSGRPDRYLTSVNLLIVDSNTDLTLMAFKDDHRGLAWAASTTYGNALVAYADGAFRKGRDRGTVQPIGDLQAGSFREVPVDHGDWSMSLTVGGAYTFDSGLELSVEYFRNGMGYDAGEWRLFEQLIDANAANFDAGLHQTPPPEINLKRLNGVLNSVYLRKNYVLSRAAVQGALWPGSDIEAIAFHNLDDGSGVLSARFEQDIRQSVTLGAYAAFQYGDVFSEFGLRATSARGILYATVQF